MLLPIEVINLKNLKFLLRPRIALSLIRGKVPNTDEFRIAIERAKNEINVGFHLLPQYVEAISRLTGASGKEIYTYFEDLKSNDKFYVNLKSKIMQYGCYAGINISIFAPLYYIMFRILKPKVAVETGVANGVSTCFFLQAMEDNDEGVVYSIDFPALITHPSGQSGWLIPEWLRCRWHLIIGRSAKKLKPLLKNLGVIDFFVSDSAHYYKNEMFEFSTAWQFLRSGGYLGCDEVTHCSALRDFSNKIQHEMVTFDGSVYAMGFIRKR